MSHLCS